MDRFPHFIVLPGPRPRFMEQGGELLVTIPARRPLWVLAVLVVWLGLSMRPGIRAWSTLLTEMPQVFGLERLLATLALGSLSVLWLYGSIAALWMAMGVETVSLTPDRLVLSRQLVALRSRATYEARWVSGLHASPQPYDLLAARVTQRVLGLVGGTVCFSYKGQEVRFGGGLQRDYADEVVATIARYLREQQVGAT